MTDLSPECERTATRRINYVTCTERDDGTHLLIRRMRHPSRFFAAGIARRLSMARHINSLYRYTRARGRTVLWCTTSPCSS